MAVLPIQALTDQQQLAYQQQGKQQCAQLWTVPLVPPAVQLAAAVTVAAAVAVPVPVAVSKQAVVAHRMQSHSFSAPRMAAVNKLQLA
jgi:hypothetical protein